MRSSNRILTADGLIKKRYEKGRMAKNRALWDGTIHI